MQHNNSQTTSGSARRSAGRARSGRTPRTGRVIFNGQGNPVLCAVREFTDQRAVLTMSGWMGFPSEFHLYVEPDGIRACCTVNRRKGSTVEVKLSGIEQNIRYRA